MHMLYGPKLINWIAIKTFRNTIPHRVLPGTIRYPRQVYEANGNLLFRLDLIGERFCCGVSGNYQLIGSVVVLIYDRQLHHRIEPIQSRPN